MKYRKLLPFIISLILIGILISYAPWRDVADAVEDCSIGAILILVLLSMAYYALKSLRFWYLLNAMDINKPFWIVALSYMSAQPVSLLPAGEIYRSHQLQQYTGVPIKDSFPQFTMQGILEGFAMVSLALLSALTLQTLRLPFIGLAILLAIITLAIREGRVADFSRLLNKLPFVNVTQSTIEGLNRRHQAVLSRQWLPLLLSLSFAIELVGAAIAYVSIAGIGGHINFYQAVLLYVIPVIIGFVSLLPGGLGISEQSAVGILLLAGEPVAKAVGATLIMRVTIVLLGVVYGCIALLIGRSLGPGVSKSTQRV
jgi:uncharacterized protein (TIRG00374 family)